MGAFWSKINDLAADVLGITSGDVIVIGTIFIIAIFATTIALVVTNKNRRYTNSRNRENLPLPSSTTKPNRTSILAMPITVPTISQAPSEIPSTSLLPTTSHSPTNRPSRQPSIVPSNSLQPSIMPTFEPTYTFNPTQTPSSAPSRTPVSEDYSFRLRMHWQRKFEWQEEKDERRYCIECTKCRSLSSSGSPGGLCNDDSPNQGTDCELNDQLWIRNCNNFSGGSGNAVFEIIRHSPRPNDGDLIKIRDKNLCIERTDGKYLHLKQCNTQEMKQWFVGFQPDGVPFDLKPAMGSTGDEQQQRCISQHHWPKPSELLFLEKCHLAHRSDTALWEAI